MQSSICLFGKKVGDVGNEFSGDGFANEQLRIPRCEKLYVDVADLEEAPGVIAWRARFAVLPNPVQRNERSRDPTLVLAGQVFNRQAGRVPACAANRLRAGERRQGHGRKGEQR